jgi:hypothetical protein
MGKVRLDDEKHDAIQPSQPHWSARKPIRKANRPGHLVYMRNSGEIWPRVGIHLGNVG